MMSFKKDIATCHKRWNSLFFNNLYPSTAFALLRLKKKRGDKVKNARDDGGARQLSLSAQLRIFNEPVIKEY